MNTPLLICKILVLIIPQTSFSKWPLVALFLLSTPLLDSKPTAPSPAPPGQMMLMIIPEAMQQPSGDSSPALVPSLIQRLQDHIPQLEIHTSSVIPTAEQEIAGASWNSIIFFGSDPDQPLAPEQISILQQWLNSSTSIALLGNALSEIESDPSLSNALSKRIATSDSHKTLHPLSTDKTLSNQMESWYYRSASGDRTFALIGAPLPLRWNEDAICDLLLNALLWTAGIDKSANHAPSEPSPTVRYATIEEAIARGDIEDVQLHLQVDPLQIDRPGRGGYTPLHLAVLRLQPKIVEVLIQAGCSVDALTTSNESALHLAVRRNSTHIVTLLMHAGADATLRDRVGWTPLHHAAADRKVECLKILLEQPATVTALSAAGGTALHEAAATGDATTVQLLLDSGVDVSHRSTNGKSARDIAIEFGNHEALKVLDEWNRAE